MTGDTGGRGGTVARAGAILEAELLQPHALFLAKPFLPSDLARAVRELLDRGRPTGRDQGSSPSEA